MNYNKKLNTIKKLRWLSPLMGAIMFIGTVYSFGVFTALLLGFIATSMFWLIINRYYAQTILEIVKEKVNAVISNIKGIDSIVEINSINSLMIARVYIINSSIQSHLIKEALVKKISDKIATKHLKAIQIALISSKDEYKPTKEAFNKQLAKELLKKSSDTK
ncbi:MAG: hypothetical protein JJE03_01715 [Peptostreptococcaceae bacterium]|nr:hypothetical protein [Peptostreptococcaceae bacterium]